MISWFAKILTIQLDFVEADRDHLQQELKDARATLAELRTSATTEEVIMNTSKKKMIDTIHQTVNLHVGVKFKWTIIVTPFCIHAIVQLFNEFPSLTVVGADADGQDHNGGGDEEEEDASGAIESGGEEKHAFAAFAVVSEDAPDYEDSHNKPLKPARTKSSTTEAALGAGEGVDADALAKANEWKLRRQELHKRLEQLHKSQQL